MWIQCRYWHRCGGDSCPRCPVLLEVADKAIRELKSIRDRLYRKMKALGRV